MIAIQLDDIDWRAGTILIRGKGKRHDRMPLPEDAGKAIVDYIRNGRRGSSRTLFVSNKVPYRPFVNAQILNTALSAAFERPASGRRRSTSARTCCGTASRRTCCARAHRSTRSATCCGIARAHRRQSMPSMTSMACARSRAPGRSREAAHDDAVGTSCRLPRRPAQPRLRPVLRRPRPARLYRLRRSRGDRSHHGRSVPALEGRSARPTTTRGRTGSAWCAASPAG